MPGIGRVPGSSLELRPDSESGRPRLAALWQSQKKGGLTTSAMRQMIDVLVRDASARGLMSAQTSAHTLRHTFARNYQVPYPGDVVGLATLLGHTPLETTRIYSQPTVAQHSTRVRGWNTCDKMPMASNPLTGMAWECALSGKMVRKNVLTPFALT